MLEMLSTIVLIGVLFYLIGRSADVVIANFKSLGVNLGIQQFWLGLVLGLLTSTPEIMVGTQALLQGVPQLSFGNLMGGIVVLLGLIAGVSVVVDREVDLSWGFRHHELIILTAYISLPLWLGLDGSLGSLDGLALMVGYAMVVAYMIRVNHRPHPEIRVEPGTSNLQSIWRAMLGLLAVMILAKLILMFALPLASRFAVPPLLLGLLVFSLGTNMPELTLAFRSWREGSRDLSFGNLIGSAFTNPLILGVFSFFQPVTLVVGVPYVVLTAIILLLLLSFTWFAYTNQRLTWREGWALLGLYLAFLGFELWWH